MDHNEQSKLYQGLFNQIAIPNLTEWQAKIMENILKEEPKNTKAPIFFSEDWKIEAQEKLTPTVKPWFEPLDDVEDEVEDEGYEAEDPYECDCGCNDPDYCADCESSPCRCCEDCGNASCTCTAASPHREDPPWVDRGITEFDLKGVQGLSWEEVWPEIEHKEIDPIQSAADFYILEAISANVVFPGIKVRTINIPSEDTDREFFRVLDLNESEQRRFVQRRNDLLAERLVNDPIFTMADISERAGRKLAELVDRLDTTFISYSHMACAGEARHHRALKAKFFLGNRETTWVEWRPMFDRLGNQGLIDLADLFMEFEAGAFGGQKWADACKVLFDRLEGNLGPTQAMNKRLFIDRIWTLEHNGGCFLNKINWKVHNRKSWGLGSMRAVLDAHHASDFRVLYGVASEGVRNMLKDYGAAAESIVGMAALPEWMQYVGGNIKPRIICSACGSNPVLGHQTACRMIRRPASWEFDGIVDPSKTKKWYRLVEPDEFDQYDWLSWHSDNSGFNYPVGPKGIKLEPEDVATITFQFTIDSEGRGWYDGYSDYEVPLGELEAGKYKISLKRFNHQAGPIGRIHNLEYSYTISCKGVSESYSFPGAWSYNAVYEDGISIGLPDSFATMIHGEPKKSEWMLLEDVPKLMSFAKTKKPLPF